MTPFVYDPTTVEFQENPLPLFTELRDHHPVYHNPDDEREFTQPERFDIHRKIDEFHKRIPEYHLDGPPVRWASNWLRVIGQFRLAF